MINFFNTKNFTENFRAYNFHVPVHGLCVLWNSIDLKCEGFSLENLEIYQLLKYYLHDRQCEVKPLETKYPNGAIKTLYI